MRYLLRCGERLGDVLMCFPALKYLHDQGHDVMAYCLPQYAGVFDLISYARLVEGPGVAHDTHIDMQINPPRIQQFLEGEMHVWEFQYTVSDHVRPAFGKPIVFDRPVEVPDYGLPEEYALISPFGYTTAAHRPPLPWFVRQVEALRGTVKGLHVLSDRKDDPRAKKWPVVCAERLSHLPEIIRKAKVFITVNSAPSIIASVVRESYHHVVYPVRREMMNWKAPNQVLLEYEKGETGCQKR